MTVQPKSKERPSDLGPGVAYENGTSKEKTLEGLGPILRDNSDEEEIAFSKDDGGTSGEHSKRSRRSGAKRGTFMSLKSKYGSHVDLEYIESGKYPADCYSLLSLHGPIDNPKFFLFGFMVFSFQMSFLMLMVLSRAFSKWKTGTVDDNPSEEWYGELFATESSPLVKGAQVMSLLTYIIFADASLADMITAVHTFPKFKQTNANDRILCMVFSCTLRFVQGFLAMIVAVILVITSNDVIDIILNFTALNFISALDDVAFEFSLSGKYG
jgi:hypothetical protein